MDKILGIDLGTNSIGLTLRKDNEFTWYGTYTFRKGVGRSDSGEFSFAAERTKHRSLRRLYNARRYRKWETLKVLIDNDYCPLDTPSLNRWKYYKKGVGRIFPRGHLGFDCWTKLDFNCDGNPDFKSPYQIRRKLIQEKLDLTKNYNREILGRALYHIAQRRGFKSSRKTGKNEKSSVYKGSPDTNATPYNKYKEELKKHETLGAYFAHLEDKGIRIRNRYTLRSDYKKEAQKILAKQGLSGTQFEKDIIKAIFFQRPLRSQKGTIGKGTMEPDKPRCPMSHPAYEEYRALQFINNLKYKNDQDKFTQLPERWRQDLYNAQFYKQARFIPFSDIRKYLNKKAGKELELNYKKKSDQVKIAICPVSARLRQVFGDNWKDYYFETTRIKPDGTTKMVSYDIYDIWHILFSFEDEEYFKEFCLNTLNLSIEQFEDLFKIWNDFPVGYGSLSLKAINNLLPFLRKGLIYTEAILLAKIPEVIGKKLFKNNEAFITKEIKNVIKENRDEKTHIRIANNLIANYFLLDFEDRFGHQDPSYKLDTDDKKAVLNTCKKYFGESIWEKKEDNKQSKILKGVEEKYQFFFAQKNRNYLEQPKLMDKIKQFIDDNFNPGTESLEMLYHPSQIDIYDQVKESEDGNMYLQSPETRAFKNPMAYKTLHNLRAVLNNLLKEKTIDRNTRIVVEVARELNYSNKRNAIERYQNKRERENEEFSKAIEELLKDNLLSVNANPNNIKDIRKFRLWAEQTDDYEGLYKKVSAKKTDKEKYQLWKEQGCLCLYTGRIIKLSDLFNENVIDFEHTIPLSKSFDNSLSNLTVCYQDYNRNTKGNRLPVELPNFKEHTDDGHAIRPHLDDWIKKRDRLKDSIEHYKAKSKTAQDKESKDTAVQNRHLKEFEYDYWRKKVDRFTRKDVPDGFKNSQLIDTQIISKYALHYLKTVFERVDIERGSTTEEFRKIFKIQPKEEKKDRSKHYHHAIDAAVLTLIPKRNVRDEMLQNWYDSKDNSKKEKAHAKPFPGFSNKMIENLKEDILNYHIPKQDQAFTPGKKYVRKRGRQVWATDGDGNLVYDENGKKKPKIAQGDSVRGQLHKDTYYGKIKRAKKKDGSLVRDKDGNIQYNQVDGKDEIWMVIRKPIEEIKFKTDIIIDEYLDDHLKEQLKKGVKQNELKDFQGNTIRHLRCRVKSGRGFMKPKNATVVKEQTYASDKEYKNYYYANSGDNYLFGLYETESGNRQIVDVNLFEAAKINNDLEINDLKDFFENTIENVGRKKEIGHLVHVFQTGQKVLMFYDNQLELKSLGKEGLSERLYFVKTLFDANAQRILFQHHLEGRSDDKLKEDFQEKNSELKEKMVSQNLLKILFNQDCY